MHRRWLLTCDVVLKQAFDHRQAAGKRTDEEEYQLYFNLEIICNEIKECLTFTATRMEQGDAKEKAAVANMLGYYRRAIATLPAVVPQIEAVESEARIADERGAENARKHRSEKTKRKRLDIIRPLILKALREAGDGPVDLRASGDAVEAALRRAGIKPVSEKTLKRDIETVEAEVRTGRLPN